MGLLLIIVVHAASIQDRDGAKLVLEKARGRFPHLKHIWADGGYAGKLIQWVQTTCHWTLAIVKRTDDLKGFQVLPRRWVVQRTLGWLGRYRRLSKDYECLSQSSEAMVQVAMSRLMLARLYASKLIMRPEQVTEERLAPSFFSSRSSYEHSFGSRSLHLSALRAV